MFAPIRPRPTIPICIKSLLEPQLTCTFKLPALSYLTTLLAVQITSSFNLFRRAPGAPLRRLPPVQPVRPSLDESAAPAGRVPPTRRNRREPALLLRRRKYTSAPAREDRRHRHT